MNKPTITITNMYRIHYFQWFILGLYELERAGEIELKFRLPFFSSILQHISNSILCKFADKGRRLFERDDNNLRANVTYPDGTYKSFVIDSADAPYLFDGNDLNTTDVYFKMQYPIDIDRDRFSLTDKIQIPWCDQAHEDKSLKRVTDRGVRKILSDFKSLRHKIKPLMIGPRMLAPKTFTYEGLKVGYDHYLRDRKIKKTRSVMCYFGNAFGPKPEENVIAPDYDWEADIMGYYRNLVNHPNEKRARMAKLIEQLDGSDARVISTTNADSGIVECPDKVIQLKDFCAHIAKFKYNVNISGYRLSMPNRFIESFMVGTAVLTDKLHVKWYKPFNEEVKETAEMGYLPMNEVDWAKVEDDLKNLPETNPQKIIDDFEKKWSPKVVAKYIMDTVRKA